MRKSQLKYTPEKGKSLSKSKLTQSTSVSKTSPKLYFCHYNNAMYMGGIRSFKKESRGIMLYDNGVCALTSYTNDLLNGHNILFDNSCLLSAIYCKNKILQGVFRNEDFAILLTYNQEKELQGIIKLINFTTKSITYSTFKKGNILSKQEERDKNIISKVFQLNELELIVGREHAKVLKYQLEKLPNICIKKDLNKLMIGFQKNNVLHGLGFQFAYKDSLKTKCSDMQLKMIQCGYYQNSQLNGMGYKVFKNKNLYVGEFKGGLFNGQGILQNRQKKNWVSGYFKSGNLSEMVAYSNQGQEKAAEKIVRSLHQKNINWINNNITNVSFKSFIDTIQIILQTQLDNNVQNLQQRKQQILKRIQQKFIAQNSEEISVDQSNEAQDNNFQPKPSISKTKNQNNSDKYTIIQNLDFEPESNKKSMAKAKGSSSRVVGRIVQKQVPAAKLSYSEYTQDQKYPPKTKHNYLEKKTVQNNQSIQSQQARQRNSKMSNPAPNLQFSNFRNIQSKRRRESQRDEDEAFPLQQSKSSAFDSKRMVQKNKIFKYLKEQQSSNRNKQFNPYIFSGNTTQRKKSPSKNQWM